MKNRLVVWMTALVLALAGCASAPVEPSASAESSVQIYLYGESHGSEAVIERELELWRGYYGQGARHLFVEQPYYTAQLLNRWMAAEDDAILEELYADWAGTLSQQESVKRFYQTVKEECPETVFHGTDVGHQYWSTGARYLELLKAEGLEGSPEWDRAQMVAEQGRSYYGPGHGETDEDYREQAMVENFLWEYETLPGACIMGIYGGFHVRQGNGEGTPPMGQALAEKFGERLYREDISWLANYIESGTVALGGKSYEAECFRRDMTGIVEGFDHGDYWRLKDVGEDFTDCPVGGDVLPYYNFPVAVEDGQVFWVEYTMTDDSTLSLCYRADGYDWNGWPSCREIIVAQ